MQMLRRIVVIVSVVVTAGVAVGPSISAPAAAASAKKFDATTIRAIDAIVNATKNGSGTPGMVVGIWDPKRGTLVKGYGTGDLTDPKATIAIDDHVRIASVTKSFTATAILQLVAANKLSLDAPPLGVRARHRERRRDHRQAAPRHDRRRVLVHRGRHLRHQLLREPADAVHRAGCARPSSVPTSPISPLGPPTHYSDSNYVLLELIAEKVTGEPLGDTIQSEILDKVGLDATSYPTTSAMPDPFSHGYLAQPFGGPRDVTLGNPGVAGGAGAMISSLEDLHQWAVALGTGALLPKSLQQERLKTHPLVSHAEAHDRLRPGDHQPQRVPRPRRRDPRLRHRDVLPAQGQGHDRGRVEQRQRVGAERAVDVHRPRLVPVPGAVPEGPVTAPLEAGAATRSLPPTSPRTARSRTSRTPASSSR